MEPLAVAWEVEGAEPLVVAWEEEGVEPLAVAWEELEDLFLAACEVLSFVGEVETGDSLKQH